MVPKQSWLQPLLEQEPWAELVPNGKLGMAEGSQRGRRLVAKHFPASLSVSGRSGLV